MSKFLRIFSVVMDVLNAVLPILSSFNRSNHNSDEKK